MVSTAWTALNDRQEPTSPWNLYPAYPFVFYEHDGRQWPSPSGIPAPTYVLAAGIHGLYVASRLRLPIQGMITSVSSLLHTQLDAANASPPRIDRLAATLTTADRR